MAGPANMGRGGGGGGGGRGGGLLVIILILGTSRGSDYRTVSYEALLPSMDTFEDTGVRYFSEIVFDLKRYQMIVGARDALYRLSMDGLKVLEKGRARTTFFEKNIIFFFFSRVASNLSDNRAVHCEGTKRGAL